MPGFAPPGFFDLDVETVLPEFWVAFQRGKTARAKDDAGRIESLVDFLRSWDASLRKMRWQDSWKNWNPSIMVLGTASRKERVSPSKRAELGRQRATALVDELERQGIDRARLRFVDPDDFASLSKELPKDKTDALLDFSGVWVFIFPHPGPRGGNYGECHPGVLISALIPPERVQAADSGSAAPLSLWMCSADRCSGAALDVTTLDPDKRAVFELKGGIRAGASVAITSQGLLVLTRSTAESAADVVEGSVFSLTLFQGEHLVRRIENRAHYLEKPQYPGIPKTCKWAAFGDLREEEIWKHDP